MPFFYFTQIFISYLDRLSGVKVQAQDPATTSGGTTESLTPALPILDENTNLISLLQQIRKLVSDGDLEKAQKAFKQSTGGY